MTPGLALAIALLPSAGPEPGGPRLPAIDGDFTRRAELHVGGRLYSFDGLDYVVGVEPVSFGYSVRIAGGLMIGGHGTFGFFVGERFGFTWSVGPRVDYVIEVTRDFRIIPSVAVLGGTIVATAPKRTTASGLRPAQDLEPIAFALRSSGGEDYGWVAARAGLGLELVDRSGTGALLVPFFEVAYAESFGRSTGWGLSLAFSFGK